MMKTVNKFVVILLLLALSCVASSTELQPFATDGCSEFPNGTPTQQDLWLQCCVAHDRSYWLGGSYAQRQQADDELQSCVAKVGEPEIALLMLAGVRVGGSPYWNTRFRWGYGWPYWSGWWPRGYSEMTDKEKIAVTVLIEQAETEQGE